MGEQETIWAAVGVLRAWMERYGVPRAPYTDWKKVYVREPTAKEYLDGTPARTQFGRMCEWEDGTIEIHYRGRNLSWQAVAERPAISRRLLQIGEDL